jgi:hypothetical protein
MSKFYILDARSIVGNCALFWRPDGAGYTTQLDDAGLYDEADAKSHRETDVAIPEHMAKACAVTHIRVERLREAMDQAGIKWPITGKARR